MTFSLGNLRRVLLKQRLRLRGAISRRRWRCLQLHARTRTRHGTTSPRMKSTMGESRSLMLGLAKKNPLRGPFQVTNLALVYAWTGERDRALDQLETVATIPSGPTYGDLRFNPC